MMNMEPDEFMQSLWNVALRDLGFDPKRPWRVELADDDTALHLIDHSTIHVDYEGSSRIHRGTAYMVLWYIAKMKQQHQEREIPTA